MNIEDLTKLKQDLVEGILTPQRTGEILFTDKTKSWFAKEWKKKKYLDKR